MINLKLSKKEAKKRDMPQPVSGTDNYPWGTTLSFEDETLGKIKALQGIEAGTMVNIRAVGKVVTISMSDHDKGKDHKSITIQLQQIDIGNAESAEAAFNEED
uniref:Putative capsid protein n=1 Tax=viral metagenome TaxID=1070528 RepID=A0A6M3IMQ1_9ZZZZ